MARRFSDMLFASSSTLEIEYTEAQLDHMARSKETQKESLQGLESDQREENEQQLNDMRTHLAELVMRLVRLKAAATSYTRSERVHVLLPTHLGGATLPLECSPHDSVAALKWKVLKTLNCTRSKAARFQPQDVSLVARRPVPSTSIDAAVRLHVTSQVENGVNKVEQDWALPTRKPVLQLLQADRQLGTRLEVTLVLSSAGEELACVGDVSDKEKLREWELQDLKDASRAKEVEHEAMAEIFEQVLNEKEQAEAELANYKETLAALKDVSDVSQAFDMLHQARKTHRTEMLKAQREREEHFLVIQELRAEVFSLSEGISALGFKPPTRRDSEVALEDATSWFLNNTEAASKDTKIEYQAGQLAALGVQLSEAINETAATSKRLAKTKSQLKARDVKVKSLEAQVAALQQTLSNRNWKAELELQVAADDQADTSIKLPRKRNSETSGALETAPSATGSTFAPQSLPSLDLPGGSDLKSSSSSAFCAPPLPPRRPTPPPWKPTPATAETSAPILAWMQKTGAVLQLIKEHALLPLARGSSLQVPKAASACYCKLLSSLEDIIAKLHLTTQQALQASGTSRQPLLSTSMCKDLQLLLCGYAVQLPASEEHFFDMQGRLTLPDELLSKVTDNDPNQVLRDPLGMFSRLCAVLTRGKNAKRKDSAANELLALSEAGSALVMQAWQKAQMQWLSVVVTGIPDQWTLPTGGCIVAQATFFYLFEASGAETHQAVPEPPCKNKRGESVRSFLLVNSRTSCLLLTTWKHKYRYRLDLKALDVGSDLDQVLILQSAMFSREDVEVNEAEADVNDGSSTYLLCSSTEMREAWVQILQQAVDRVKAINVVSEDDGQKLVVVSAGKAVPLQGSGSLSPSARLDARLRQVSVAPTQPEPQIGLTLEELLQTPYALALYKRFAEAGFMSENIHFIEAVMQYRSHPSLSRGQDICEKFVAVLAPEQVNISNELRSRTLALIQAAKSDGDLNGSEFQMCDHEVRQLMQNDSFDRFKKSTYFRQWQHRQATKDFKDPARNSVKVYLRVRPFVGDQEQSCGDSNLSIKGNTATLKQSTASGSRRPDRIGHYDHIFGLDATQADVFQDIGHSVMGALTAGFNAAVICYGNTGAGKTYTMFGTKARRGLVARILERIFYGNVFAHGCTQVRLSYVQVYNGKLQDLQSKSAKPGAELEKIAVRLTKNKTMLKGVVLTPVRSPAEAMLCVLKGNQQRSSRAHAMNRASSRSHAILSLHISTKTLDDRPVKGMIKLVDLAGSENAAMTKVDQNPEALQEAREINKSLISMGRVINALNQNARRSKGKQLVVPFRGSVLMEVLRSVLQERFVCSVVLNVSCSPALEQTRQTAKTMAFGEGLKGLGSIRSAASKVRSAWS